MVSGTLALPEKVVLEVEGEPGQRPQRGHVCFNTYGTWPQGWDLGLQAWILAFKLGFRPRGLELGLLAGIWTSRLRFGPQGWDLGL